MKFSKAKQHAFILCNIGRGRDGRPPCSMRFHETKQEKNKKIQSGTDGDLADPADQ